MANEPRPSSLFGHIDVTQQSTPQPAGGVDSGAVIISLLRQMVAAQDRQNELMEEMISQSAQAQKQRATELGQWKQANPYLSRRCREAAETLGRVQTEFLDKVTDEICDNSDCLLEGDFMLNEFVDRFGPRLAHLNGVLQVLSQLGSSGENDAKS